VTLTLVALILLYHEAGIGFRSCAQLIPNMAIAAFAGGFVSLGWLLGLLLPRSTSNCSQPHHGAAFLLMILAAP